MKEIEILIFVVWFYISILVFEKNKNGYVFQCTEYDFSSGKRNLT